MHGIGLQSARRIVEKYSGQLKAEAKDDIFTLICVMKNAKMTDLSKWMILD
jgi:light-regulated signal transduction histidine kinase (bacteriophytochrome)